MRHCQQAKGGAKDWDQIWHQSGQQLPQNSAHSGGLQVDSPKQSLSLHCSVPRGGILQALCFSQTIVPS